MRYQNFLAGRFYKSKKGGFLSFISFISVIGIAVGVFSLIVVLSVMNGFTEDLTEKVIGTKAHIYISSMYGGIKDPFGTAERIKKLPGILGASPVSSSEIMIRDGDSVGGGILFGIDPESIDTVTDFGKYLIIGEPRDIKDGGAVIGSELALELSAGINDKITLISPNVKVTPSGAMVPKTVELTIKGVIKTGMYEYDKSFIYADLEDFNDLFDTGKGTATSLYVKIKDIYATRRYMDMISPLLSPGHYMRDWIDMNHNLFTALKTEKFVMGLILFMIIFVAGINIINTIVMLVQEKRKEIGILRALGSRSSGIKRIFLLQGAYIGAIGTAIGAFAGIITVVLIDVLNIRIPGGGVVYYLDVLPVRLKVLPDILVIIAGAMAISLVFSLLPASWASRIDPIKAIRHE